ncbi:MAG: molybdenum cofactor guanylyltransferase [Actinomycetota bacterium]|nr:molybdenum cofactor guanylyltransferase [Actinomycetota bacterium]
MDRPIVAVLAGGDSTRMGSDKAAVPFASSTMLETVLNSVATVGDPIVVGRTSAPNGVPAIPDRRQGSRGPLTGLEAVLEHEPGRTIVLVAVDHPFLRPQTLREMLALEGDAVVPFDERWQQVTCAVYRPTFLRAASETLDAGCRSIISALDLVTVNLVGEVTWRSWDEDGRSWFSVDTPERLEEGLRRFG